MKRFSTAMLLVLVLTGCGGAPETGGEKAYNAFIRKKFGGYDGAERRFSWYNLTDTEKAAWEAAAEAAMTQCEGGK